MAGIWELRLGECSHIPELRLTVCNMVQPAFLLAVQNFRIQQEAEGAYVTSPSTDPWHKVPDELPRKDSISHSSSQLTAGGTKRVLGESMGKGSWTPSLVPVGCTPGTTSLC